MKDSIEIGVVLQRIGVDEDTVRRHFVVIWNERSSQTSNRTLERLVVLWSVIDLDYRWY